MLKKLKRVFLCSLALTQILTFTSFAAEYKYTELPVSTNKVNSYSQVYKTLKKLGVPDNAKYVTLRGLLHSSGLDVRYTKPGNDCNIVYTEHSASLPCDAYLVKYDSHEYTNNRCHRTISLPNGGFECGDRQYFALQTSKLPAQLSGSTWVDASSNESSHTNYQIYRIKLIHKDNILQHNSTHHWYGCSCGSAGNKSAHASNTWRYDANNLLEHKTYLL